MTMMEYVQTGLNVILFIGCLASFFKGKGTPQQIESVVEGSKSVVEAAEKVLAPTPLKPFLNVLDTALGAAEVGVHYAEQLFKSGNDVDRKAVATSYVVNTLKELGITVTPRLAVVIDGAVEAAVLALPPTERKQVPNQPNV